GRASRRLRAGSRAGGRAPTPARASDGSAGTRRRPGVRPAGGQAVVTGPSTRSDAGTSRTASDVAETSGPTALALTGEFLSDRRVRTRNTLYAFQVVTR